MENTEFKGFWWLPNTHEKKVAGILKYNQHQQIQLELIGTIQDEESIVDLFQNDRKVAVIFGIDENAKPITLLQCFGYASFNFSSEFPIQKFICQYALVGIHLAGMDTPRFSKAIVEIPNLSNWCRPTLISTTLSHSDNGPQKIDKLTIEMSLVPIVRQSVNIDSNTKITLSESSIYSGEDLNPQVSQHTTLHIEKMNSASLNEILKNISLFEQFLSIAILEECHANKIILNTLDLFQEISENRKLYHSIEVLRREQFINEQLRTDKHQFLFDYTIIKEKYPEIIRKWYQESDIIGPIRSYLIENLKYKSSFVCINFTLIIHAIEGFWNRFRDKEYKVRNHLDKSKNIKLNTIITELLSEFSSIKQVAQFTLSADAVVDSRNYYAHFVFREQKRKSLDGLELLTITDELRILLICCILNFMGFDNSKINEIISSCHNSMFN